MTSIRDLLFAQPKDLMIEDFDSVPFDISPNRSAVTKEKIVLEQRSNGGQPQIFQRNSSGFHHAEFLPLSVPPFLLFNSMVSLHRYLHCYKSFNDSVLALSWR